MFYQAIGLALLAVSGSPTEAAAGSGESTAPLRAAAAPPVSRLVVRAKGAEETAMQPLRVVNWSAQVQWLEITPVKTRLKGDSLYADILNHTRDYQSYRDHSIMADAHENTHAINNDLGNRYTSDQTRHGFYVGYGRGIVLEHPRVRLREVAAYLPKEMREYRYQTYLVKAAKDWHDGPLYLFDEWVAYCNSGAVGVELVQRGHHTDPPCDGVSGCVEFLVYGTALGMAIEDLDPDYFNRCPQFKPFFAWMIERSITVYRQGRHMAVFPSSMQDELYLRLGYEEAGKPMREFLRRQFGRAWVEQVLEF